ncbi:hypothetical protein BCR39DRAFT_592578 [Naematelia encephala]|uniref:S-adenosyl-L-methionine-dependent methyltransferase n=1 Tax=Naematelia encephala TaxID=71784 RepID=A0A1Y2BGL9_9TREE|nr:hypothetical protein BCR39DRAFT_592578 [Naematelia encephala]
MSRSPTEQLTPQQGRSNPRTTGQTVVRIASLYIVPALLAVPISLVLNLTTHLLIPLYNTLPLTLHITSLYVILTLVPATLYWYATHAQGARSTASARAALIIAALGADLVVVSGRNVGSLTGSFFGPERGATAARVILGLPVVGGGLGFALICFDHIWPVRAATTNSGILLSFFSVVIRAVGYLFHVYYCERIWSWFLSSGSSILVWKPENTILFLSLLITISSFFIRLSSSSTPFSHMVHSTLSRSLRLSPAGSNRLSSLTSYLPHQVYPLLLLLRLPIIILAVRQQIFLRPLPPYFTPSGQLRILSSERSISGQVVVADNLRDGYRFLRCDHSLLGGRWVREVSTRFGSRTEMGDSIFATFVIQEVGVLAQRSDTNESLERTMSLTTELQVLPEEEEDETDETGPPDRALVIGLGIGVAASAFTGRGIDIDIVELDPAVYSAAVSYFNLSVSSTSSATFMDGAAYIQQVANLSRGGEWEGQKWSYAIQDCFTGGSVPGEMFTREFWTDLSELIEVDGIVAINLAGVRNSKATRAALVTILSVFSQCRAFGDVAEAHRGDDELVNLVVFCTMTHSLILSFREPTTPDFQRSPLRSHVYTSFLSRETQLDEIIKPEDWNDQEMLLKRGEAKMDAWQREASISTWYAMQQLLSKEMWLAW